MMDCGKKESVPEDALEYFDFVNPRIPRIGPHVFVKRTDLNVSRMVV
jgi:hypothetical protein